MIKRQWIKRAVLYSSILKSLAAVSVLTLAVTSEAQSGEFEFLTGASEPQVAVRWSYRIQCNFRLTGEITHGDADRFDGFLEQFGSSIEKDRLILGYPRVAVLCLNSAGGSLVEAIKIAERIRSSGSWSDESAPFIATRLERDAECMSACALVFMAGTMDDFEGPAYIARSMHPTARLGVHAPALSIPNGSFDQNFVTSAYDVSMNTIAEVLRVLNIGRSSDGTDFSGESTWLKTSMLTTMLQTPHTSMTFVETVDDAGRWGIDVFPIVTPEISPESLLNACTNMVAWRDGRPSVPYGDAIPIPLALQDAQTGSPEVARSLFVLDELNGWECETVIYEDGTYWIAPVRAVDQLMSGPSFALFEPQLPLSDISTPGSEPSRPVSQNARTFWAPAIPRTASDFAELEAVPISKGAAWEPRYGGTAISYWSHNGSGMAWEQRDEYLWIWYFEPREGLADVGVVPGSLLFFSDQNYRSSGVARRFSNRCEDIIYDVEKTSLETRRYVFEGVYQRQTTDCRAGEMREDQLVFEHIASSPDLNAIRQDGSAPRNAMRIINVNTGLNFRALPSSNGEKLLELPADLEGIQLLSCRPLIQPGLWGNGNQQARRNLLDESWCSLEYNGQTGFVSGRYLDWR